MLKFIVDGRELTEEEIKDEIKKVEIDQSENSVNNSHQQTEEDINKFINILD